MDKLSININLPRLNEPPPVARKGVQKPIEQG